MVKDRCPECARFVYFRWRYCPECGHKIEVEGISFERLVYIIDKHIKLKEEAGEEENGFDANGQNDSQ